MKRLALSRSHCSVVSKDSHHNETPQLGALKAWDQSRLWTSLRNMSLNAEFAIKPSSLLWNSWLRKSCACSQMLHFNPAAGLPCSPALGMWWGTLGLDRHGYFKPLKCSPLNDKVHCTLQSTVCGCWALLGGKLIACTPSSTSYFYLLVDTAVLGLPKAVPVPASSKPQISQRKGASGLRMQCDQCRTAFSQPKSSGAQHYCWPGLVVKYCLR